MAKPMVQPTKSESPWVSSNENKSMTRFHCTKQITCLATLLVTILSLLYFVTQDQDSPVLSFWQLVKKNSGHVKANRTTSTEHASFDWQNVSLHLDLIGEFWQSLTALIARTVEQSSVCTLLWGTLLHETSSSCKLELYYQ